jgi:hypothetical protein
MAYYYPVDKRGPVGQCAPMVRPKLPPERKLYRIAIMISPAMVTRLDDARRSGWADVPSRGEAVRRLLDEGLSRHETKKAPRPTKGPGA